MMRLPTAFQLPSNWVSTHTPHTPYLVLEGTPGLEGRGPNTETRVS